MLSSLILVYILSIPLVIYAIPLKVSWVKHCIFNYVKIEL